MKKKFMLSLMVSVLFISTNIRVVIAQSWNVTGNSNATSSSKLGTTNLAPLKFFTNNSQRMIVDSLGRVGIGITKPINIFTIKSGGGTPSASWLNGLNTPVFVGFGETVSSEFLLAGASNTAINRAVFQGRRSRGTLAAPTAVANNDYITSLLASAYDGSTFQNPALVSFFVDGTPSAGNVPTRISFVTGSNAGNRTERLKVGSTGNFNFNNNQLFLQQSTGSVGIGTITPVSKLEVRNGTFTITNTTTTANLVINRANSVAGSSNQISFQDNGITKWALGGTNIGSAGANNLSFYNYNLGSNALTILNSNNNVGIGTIDPGNYKLKLSYDQESTNGSYGLDIENKCCGGLVDWELYVAPDEHPTYYGALVFFRNGELLAGINSAGQYRELSDERLKTNIKPMATMLNKINELKPSTYQFKNTRDGQEHNGFIAQDVMKIFPTLVTHNVIPERKVDVYTMDYSGFGVLAIKGIQELVPIIEKQKIVNDEQKKEIATLNDRISKLEEAFATIIANKNGNISNAITNASLEQNKPNPFTHNTTIGYSLPENFANAQIKISDKNGKILKAINISGNGKGVLNVDASILSSGAYNYSLFVNGKLVNTKQMERLK